MEETISDHKDIEKSDEETIEFYFTPGDREEKYLKLNCISSAYCKCHKNSCQLSRITPVSSPVLTVFYGKDPINITLDSGATTSFVTLKLCEKLNLEIHPNGQLARLGDGCTMIACLGEINVMFTRDKWSVKFQAIVVEKLNTDIYGGMNFFEDNDISIRFKTGEIKIDNKHTVYQTNTLMLPPQLKTLEYTQSSITISKLPKCVLFPSHKPIWNIAEKNLANDFPLPVKEKHIVKSSLDVVLPPSLSKEKFVVIGPRTENMLNDWPPEQVCPVKEGTINLVNKTHDAISIPSQVHTIDVVPTSVTTTEDIVLQTTQIYEDILKDTSEELEKKGKEKAKSIDISRAPKQLQEQLKSAHLKFSDVFIPDLTQGYNSESGPHLIRLRFADENRPEMTRCHIPKWAGKHDVVKQKKMDALESQGVLLDPYKHDIPINLISPSFLKIKARAKDKPLDECDLSDIRWIISPAQLNPHLRQLHTNTVTKEDLFTFKAKKPHCIEFDLYEGYFQNHVHPDDWSYLAVETPFKGIRVLTRSGQGLLNQEIEMNQLLTKVLGKEIEKGSVILQADDGQVGGETEEETVKNWIAVLELCSKNNIKLNARKIKIFPETSLIYGWLFKDGYVQPDPHRKLAILDMKLPKTVGEMRTYMGVYKTFFPAMLRLTNLMHPFEQLCAGKDSKEKLDFNENLEKLFKESQNAAQTDVKKLALPRPDEQLFIVPDAASRPPALGFILFVKREPQAEPVMFVTWKLPDSYFTWSPCELEGLGASIAVEKCSFYILRSSKPTLVFPDNKQVIQAFNKLKRGRFSTSQRLATFSNSMQKFPIQMQHGSGKLLQNVGADYIGRNAADCDKENCAVCKFATNNAETLLASISNKIRGKSEQNPELDLKELAPHWELAGFQELPIGNLSAWSKLQNEDESVSHAIAYKKSGQTPPKKDKSKDMTEIRSYVANCKYNSTKKLLVKEETIEFDHEKIEKIVVPKWFVKPLLVQIHLDQNCPSQTQLKKIFDRYFHGFNMANIYKEVTDECPKCNARKKIPKEMKHFKSVTNPSSPGETFVSDVMRRSKQLILVTRDAFSDFVTTSIIDSEKAEDLKRGIISTTANVRKNSEITIRVDNAVGFLSLSNNQDKDLGDLKMKLEISDKNNKNGLAIVDKAIQELEKEISTLSPEGKPISTSDLAKAALILNSRIRNRDLSAYEIQFSREQNTGKNISLNDENLKGEKNRRKLSNHKHSEKSKFPNCEEPSDADVEVGDLVHLKNDGSKHNLRDTYIVLEHHQDKIKLAKMLHSLERNIPTKMSSKRILVSRKDIYKSSLECQRTNTAPDLPETEELDSKEDVCKGEEISKKKKWKLYDSDEEKSDGSSNEQALGRSDDEAEDYENDDNSESISVHSNNNPVSDPASDDLDTSTQEVAGVDLDTLAQDVACVDDHEADEENLDNEVEEESLDNEAEEENLDSEAEEELVRQNFTNPSRMPVPGDQIKFLDNNIVPPEIVFAVIKPMFKTMQTKHPGWFNILKEGFTKQTSVNLTSVRWKYVNNDDEVNATIQNDNVEDEVEEQFENDHETAFTEEKQTSPHLHMAMPEVRNLDLVLPLTSTLREDFENQPSGRSKSRLSEIRPRGPLPMEFEDSPVARPGPSRIRDAIARRARSVQKAIFNETDSSDE